MLANPKGYGAKDSSPATDPANPNPSNPPIIIIIIMVIAAFLSPPCVSRTPPAPPESPNPFIGRASGYRVTLAIKATLKAAPRIPPAVMMVNSQDSGGENRGSSVPVRASANTPPNIPASR